LQQFADGFDFHARFHMDGIFPTLKANGSGTGGHGGE
jgi:hypothetical protein